MYKEALLTLVKMSSIDDILSDHTVAKGDLLFGFSLLSYLKGENVSISPLSVRIALAMLYEGAEGDTAKQISQIARLPEKDKVRQGGFKSLVERLNSNNEYARLNFKNGLWLNLRQITRVSPDFLKVLKSSYGAEVNYEDFGVDSEGKRRAIGGWLNEETSGKLSNLFPKGSLVPDTTLVIANALSFKALWESEFDPKYTQSQDFYLPNGEVVKVDMMRKGEVESYVNLPKFEYAEIKGLQMVCLPYKKGASAIFMLPPKGESVGDIERYLKEEKVNTLWDLTLLWDKKKFSRLEIPKHTIKGAYSLKEPLKQMGISNIWEPNTAEFGQISKGQVLFVNDIFHNTYFKTDEKGSEGAAATGFSMMRGIDNADAVEFIANRPFIELIVDNYTGSVLFLNKVERPKW